MARRRKGRPLHGWLVIDKPAGVTSTQIVAQAKRLMNAAKAGHGGTLDPIATGILPIAFGEATKTVFYAVDGQKAYRFTVRWGEARDTEDSEGAVTATSDARPARAAIEAILPRFCGDIVQRPPIYSAIKIGGERAYDLARDGVTPDLALRPVRIDRFALVEQPDADHAVFEVTCGRGTYVRSLARDVALALGTVGHVSALRRTRVGPFTLDQAITPETLAALSPEEAEEHLLPIVGALRGVPSLDLTEQEAQSLRMGQTVSLLRRSDQERLLRVNEALGDDGGPALAVTGRTPVALVRVELGEVYAVRVLNV